MTLMPNEATHPKVLIVLSNDFGELAMALNFTEGQEFDITLLLPERLEKTKTEGLQRRTEYYPNILNLIASVRRHKPDLLLLFSGYLFTLDGIMAVGDMATIIKFAKDQGSRVATTDPFLGVISRLDEKTISDLSSTKTKMLEIFSAVFKVLRNIPHLYLADASHIPRIQSFSYFNPSMLESLTVEVLSPRSWAFVLSIEDYYAVCVEYGQHLFDEWLVKKLRQTVEAGARPVLIAPEQCIRSVERRRPPQNWLPIAHCGIMQFQELLREAEYAFYFNVFSSSVLARGMNDRPIFFFDLGYLVRMVPTVFQAGVASYYAGTAPPILDMNTHLTYEVLRPLAESQKEGFRAAREKFLALPTPDVVVNQLLGRIPK